jgi:hypothetical protein
MLKHVVHIVTIVIFWRFVTVTSLLRWICSVLWRRINIYMNINSNLIPLCTEVLKKDLLQTRSDITRQVFILTTVVPSSHLNCGNTEIVAVKASDDRTALTLSISSLWDVELRQWVTESQLLKAKSVSPRRLSLSGQTYHWRWIYYVAPKRRNQITHWCNFMSQKDGIFNHTAEETRQAE